MSKILSRKYELRFHILVEFDIFLMYTPVEYVDATFLNQLDRKNNLTEIESW